MCHRLVVYLPVGSRLKKGTSAPSHRGVDPVFYWVRTHPLCRSWVEIGIGPTHFLRWIVYYCVSIQNDIDKSQISLIELCKTLRTNSGLRAVNSCRHLFWADPAEFKIFISPADFLHRSTPLPPHTPGVWLTLHLYSSFYPQASVKQQDDIFCAVKRPVKSHRDSVTPAIGDTAYRLQHPPVVCRASSPQHRHQIGAIR